MTSKLTSSPPLIQKSNPVVRALRWTRLILHITHGLLMTTLLYPRISPSLRERLTGMWSVKLLRILNIVLTVHGARPTPDAAKLFVVSNHVSWLDIFVINAAEPSRFVAKSEIRNWPIAGRIAEAAGTIFVHRSKRSDTARTNNEIQTALAQGDTVAIFPEGTTTSGDRLLKFHTSLFEPAVSNAATVSPAAIRYYNEAGVPSDAPIFIGETTFGESMTAIIAARRLIANITFAPAISAAGVTRRDVAVASENAIAAILNVPKPHAHQHFHVDAVPMALQTSA